MLAGADADIFPWMIVMNQAEDTRPNRDEIDQASTTGEFTEQERIRGRID